MLANIDRVYSIFIILSKITRLQYTLSSKNEENERDKKYEGEEI